MKFENFVPTRPDTPPTRPRHTPDTPPTRPRHAPDTPPTRPRHILSHFSQIPFLFVQSRLFLINLEFFLTFFLILTHFFSFPHQQSTFVKFLVILGSFQPISQILLPKCLARPKNPKIVLFDWCAKTPGTGAFAPLPLSRRGPTKQVLLSQFGVPMAYEQLKMLGKNVQLTMGDVNVLSTHRPNQFWGEGEM